MDVPLGLESTAGESRGVSSVVGFVIVITLILASVTVIVAFGSTAIADTMDRSEQNLAEHTMTLFDSRTAMVALGTSDAQSLTFNQAGGMVETRPESGWISIEHIDYTAGNTELLFKEDLGALVYVNGDQEIAYQGGGVWHRTEGSEARMLSPPEFHYRGSTLTLPVVRVTGTRSSATSPRATIRSAGDSIPIYPNTSKSYDNSPDVYENPIQNGSVAIKINSTFYEGWASYARQRTTANVTVYHSNNTVRLVLESLAGSPGDFPVPQEGGSLSVNSLGDEHPISDFSLNLSVDNINGKTHWSFKSYNEGDEFEMHIFMDDKCNGGSYTGDVDFSLYYYNSSTEEARQWQANISPGSTSAFAIDCEEEILSVDFTNDNSQLEYKDIDITGSNNKWCYGEHIQERNTTQYITMNQHDTVDENRDFKANNDETETMNFTVNHYLDRLGTDYDLTVVSGPGNSECLSSGNGQGSDPVDERLSAGTLVYSETEAARFLTYLHVTENRVEISLD